MTRRSALLAMLVLFVLALGVGIFAFVSPWLVGFPMAGGWTSSVRSSLWAGGVAVAASVLALLLLPAAALTAAARRRSGEE